MPICMALVRLPMGEGRPAEQGEQRTQQARAEGESRPLRSGEGQAEDRIERERARSGEGDAEGRSGYEQRKLVPTAGIEEALGDVHADDRDQHGRDDEPRREGGEEAKGQAQAAGGLAEAGHDGHELAGPEAHRFEEPAGAGDAVSAEPAKELLGAVGGQGESEHHANQQETEFHTTPLSYSGNHPSASYYLFVGTNWYILGGAQGGTCMSPRN